ncbi:MAG TPA: TRAP transporter small permease subunit [Gammaproteobacteria bacterium]|jgi:TRAP-type C4-dicarboxylate transport system permease small subunit|nr:TRAP transporter small permease subunit [Gammaproteobacteria bacterium]
MTELVDQLPRALQGLVRAMLAFKSVLVVIACLIMAGTFFFVVIVRYGFEGDLFAYNEWLLMVCFWLFFMGGALGTYEGSHINADLLDYFTEDQRLRWLRKLVVTAIEVGVSVALVYWAVLMIYDEIESYPNWTVTPALKIPFLIPRGGILVGLLMMSFYSALHLYALIKTRPRAVQAVAD